MLLLKTTALNTRTRWKGSWQSSGEKNKIKNKYYTDVNQVGRKSGINDKMVEIHVIVDICKETKTHGREKNRQK